MRRKSGQSIRFPGHYDHYRLMSEMSTQGHTPKTLAQLCKKNGMPVSEDTISRGLSGDCRTITKLWALSFALKIPFTELIVNE